MSVFHYDLFGNLFCNLFFLNYWNFNNFFFINFIWNRFFNNFCQNDLFLFNICYELWDLFLNIHNLFVCDNVRNLSLYFNKFLFFEYFLIYNLNLFDFFFSFSQINWFLHYFLHNFKLCMFYFNRFLYLNYLLILYNYFFVIDNFNKFLFVQRNYFLYLNLG
jgi:hypothetical protein